LGGAVTNDADTDKEDSVVVVHDDDDADADADTNADDANGEANAANADADDSDSDADANANADADTDKEDIVAVSCPDDGGEENIPATGMVMMRFALCWDWSGSVGGSGVEWSRLHIAIEPPGRDCCR
jgi:hypothetical protein